MAELEGNDLGLVELTKRLHDGRYAPIAERLTHRFRTLEDIRWMPSTDEKTNTMTYRQSEPSGTHTGINEGADRESSGTGEETEPIAFLESYSRVDTKLTDLAPGNERFVRATEDKAFMNGLTKTLGNTIFYGNRAADIRAIDGFSTRFNVLGSDPDVSRVVGGGGTGSDDLMSFWIVRWSEEDGVYMHYPKNSVAGLKMEPLGRRLVQDAAGKDMLAWVTHWIIRYGISIRDSRAILRYANVETEGSTNIFDDNILIQVLEEYLDEMEGAVIYTNRRGLTQFAQNANMKTNAAYTWDTIYGKPTVRFHTVPVKRIDTLLKTESAVA